MYRTRVKAAVTEALQATFDSAYPEPDFRSVNVTIEYPYKEVKLPMLLVTYEDTGRLTVAGINHQEFVNDVNGNPHRYTRWKFTGTITITAMANSSQERDRLYDEVVRMFAFSRDEVAVGEFRAMIEANDFVGLNINFDSLQASGDAVGEVPWATGDLLYEISLSMDVVGEFISDPDARVLVRLSSIDVKSWVPGQEDPPTFPGETSDNRTVWR